MRGVGAVAAADHVHGDGELIAAELGLLRILVGIDVDQLDHPVAVGAAGRGDEVDERRAGEAERLRSAARSRR